MNPDMKQWLLVDRDEFMAWCDGCALKRTINKLIAPNEKLCERAEKKLRKGGEVILTVDNQPFSVMQDNGEGYEEKLIENLAAKPKKKAKAKNARSK